MDGRGFEGARRDGDDDPLVPDSVAVEIPRHGRVLVVSDLHLVAPAGSASTAATEALAAAIDAWTGPGAVVLAGDCFELLATPVRDPGLALDAHPALTDALRRWAVGDERHVLVLPGNHDGALAWDPVAVAAVRERLGAQVSLQADLLVDCADGVRHVRVEHGHQLDPANAFVDPRDPGETPLGHHVVQDLLPALDGITRSGWARGLELIADPGDLAAFVVSRLAYRRVAPLLAAITVPFVLAAVLALGAAAGGPSVVASLAWVALAVGAVAAVAVLGGALVWGLLARSAARGISADMTGGGGPGNEAARHRAVALGAEGVDVLVTGHSHEAELVELGGVVYANPGCGGGLLHRRTGRGPLPDVFTVARHVSWVELEADAGLRARLIVSHEQLPVLTALERWASRPDAPAPPAPTVVAQVEAGAAAALSV